MVHLGLKLIVLNVLKNNQFLIDQCVLFLANEIRAHTKSTSEIAPIQRKCQNLHFVIAY